MCSEILTVATFRSRGSCHSPVLGSSWVRLWGTCHLAMGQLTSGLWGKTLCMSPVAQRDTVPGKDSASRSESGGGLQTRV